MPPAAVPKGFACLSTLGLALICSTPAARAQHAATSGDAPTVHVRIDTPTDGVDRAIQIEPTASRVPDRFRCTTPCDLTLATGGYRLTRLGVHEDSNRFDLPGGSWRFRVRAPHTPLPPQILMITGGAGIPTGVVLAGLGLLVVVNSTAFVPPRSGIATVPGSVGLTLGAVLFVGGVALSIASAGALLAGGLWMAIQSQVFVPERLSSRSLTPRTRWSVSITPMSNGALAALTLVR